MRLSHKVTYGLACLFELAQQPTEYIDAERLARARSVPPSYAQKILQSLAHAGLLFSQKGAGYRLARPLQDITALEVINALSQEEEEATNNAGRVLSRRINDTLAKVTLDSLATAA